MKFNVILILLISSLIALSVGIIIYHGIQDSSTTTVPVDDSQNKEGNNEVNNMANIETYTGRTDGLTYSMDYDTGTLTITGSGVSKDLHRGYLYKTDGSVALNTHLHHVIVSEGITAFEKPSYMSSSGGSFSNVAGLQTISLPNGLVSIPMQFCMSTGLTSISIPKSVTSLGSHAFSNCSSLTSVTLPIELDQSGGSSTSGVFYGCPNISYLHYIVGSNGVGPDYTSSHYGGICRPDNLTTVIFDEGIKRIGNYTLFGTTRGLTQLNLPKSLESIGDYAFRGICKVRNIVIPDNVTTIGTGAFAKCLGTYNITVGKSVTSIGNSCFSSIWTLQSMTFMGDRAAIGDFSFGLGLGNQSATDEDGNTVKGPIYTNLTVYSHDNWASGTVNATSKTNIYTNFTFYYMYYLTYNVDSIITKAYQKQGSATTLPGVQLKPHYVFDGWWSSQSGGTKYGDAGQQYTFTSDTTIYAQWVPETFTVALTPVGHGSVSGGGTYSYGSTATIGAVPDAGYIFTNWSDSNTEASRSFTVTADVALSAFFAILVPLRVKVSGAWVEGVTRVKYNDQWVLAKKIYVKENDQWYESK